MTPLAIFQLIAAIGPIVTGALSASGIDTKYNGLITAIENAVASFGTAISNPANGQLSVSAITILSGISAAVAVLQAETTLNPTTLALVNAFDKAVTAGLAAYQQAGVKVDASTLQPIAPVA